ncbi:N-methyl-L-tryptophan oxidase [Kumtagia ephedrae]|uniref:N-methyl-L-tryptophan oxidase n=1 Tax=Kumtagia ephedrae TaxID=2116701 RepID=A0A2P7SRV2_9HYPH|nr:N-methyl-L-tryptophan oxidase [Mesorhizobium ephedrae]PSJ65167.1 N-methyl-L-tryptophan oxidase [Mesorhizobium ephedrae]
MKDSYTHVVLGLGGLGSAACYWLSRRAGTDVLGIEQFELGHGRGESQDHSRIIRKTYHTVPYVRFAEQAYEAWGTVEEDSGEQLVLKTGELNFWPPKTTLDEAAYNESMAACGVPYDILDAAELRRRFPQFRFDGDIHAVYQPDGGLVGAIKANEAHRRLALRNGATLLDNMPVKQIRPVNGGYEISAGGRIFSAEKIVVAGGPWTNRLLAHFGLELPLKVTHEQVTYVDSPHLQEFSPDRFPVWIWMIHDNYYGFPVYGAAGVKIAKDRFSPTDTDSRGFDPDAGNERDVLRFLEDHIPRAAGPVLYTKTCLLTHTPDADFVLDRIPGHPNCVCAVGATHAFKFASVIGRTLSELLIDGQTPADISAFRFDRAALSLPGVWNLPES